MNDSIVILTEASTQIGFGHLYRVIAIAQYFCSRDIKVTFYILGDRKLELLVKKYVPDIQVISSNKILEEEILALGSEKYLIDLHIDTLNEFSFLTKNKGLTTISIIDYAFRHYALETDYIFCVGYQDHTREEKTRVNELNREIKLYTGRDTLILRKEFLSDSRYSVRDKADRILVSMGGSDPYMITEFVSNSIILIKVPIKVSFILGPGFSSHRENKLKSLFEYTHHHVKFYKNIDKMASIMVSHDIAVINGGSTRYELAALGVPFLSLSINETQLKINEGLEMSFLGKSLGIFTKLNAEVVARHILELLNNNGKREEMSKQMRASQIGIGAEWLYNLILNKSNLK